MTNIFLVRHAQSHPSTDTPDEHWPLSTKGFEQAKHLVPILSNLSVHRVYTSPYKRCVQTIQPFLDVNGHSPNHHHDLRERCVSTKLLRDFRDVWSKSWEDFHFKLEDAESSHECQTRFVAAVREIAVSHPGEDVLVSSHGNAIALMLNAIDPSFHVEEASKIRNPDLFKITYEHRCDRFHWDRSFATDALADWATTFYETPIRWVE